MFKEMASAEEAKPVKRKYPAELKLKILAEARLTSGEAAARKYNIHPRRIREWKTKVAELSKIIYQVEQQI